MKKSGDHRERRQHERAPLQSIVVGMLNIGELETIGSIIDISLGGVKYTYNEFRTAPLKCPIHSIDLIGDSYYLFDIPCEYVWDSGVEKNPNLNQKKIRQCGIQFGKLTPWQSFSLKSIIDDCASLDNKSIISNKGTSQSSLLSALIAY